MRSKHICFQGSSQTLNQSRWLSSLAIPLPTISIISSPQSAWVEGEEEMQHWCCDGPSHTHLKGSIQLDHHHTGDTTRWLTINWTQHVKYERTQQGKLLDEISSWHFFMLRGSCQILTGGFWPLKGYPPPFAGLVLCKNLKGSSIHSQSSSWPWKSFTCKG